MRLNSRILFILLLIAALVLAACGGGDDETETPEPSATSVPAEQATDEAVEPTEAVQEATEEVETTAEATDEVEATAEATEAAGDVVEVASDFTILTAALQAANLTSTLQGTGPFTLFAPTDDAFVAALDALGMSADEVLGNPELLNSILTYHVVEGERYTVDELSELDSVTTVNGADIVISSDGGTVTLNGGQATVVSEDDSASNGTILVIDGVLLPPDVLAEMTALDVTLEVTEEAVEPTEEAAAEPTEEVAVAEPTEEVAVAEPTEEVAVGGVSSVCLVTDLGRINDGTFNQFAYEGMVRAVEEFGLESSYIETQDTADYVNNINTCVEGDYDVVVTVGFLLEDATYAAAVANPDISFVGVDQFYGDNDPIPNIVGLQFREDQGGFLVGAMAALMTQSGTVAGVYGIDIPPVVKFRNGFEQGVAYINAQDGTSVVALGVYVPDFLRPDLGQEAAAQFIGDGADVIFGAGGPTGSGGISYAAGEGVMVIGVDQDEYFTTFGGGEAPGAEFLITSAVKRVDNGVFQMIELLVNGGTLPENNTYVLEVANGGIGFAEAHDAEVPQEVTDRVAEIMAGLEDGSIETGVDPVTGALLNAPPVEEATEEPAVEPEPTEVPVAEPTEEVAVGGVSSVCLVTDLGRINDGTFNQFAYEGMVRAVEEFGLESSYIETQDTADYVNNINTCVEGDYDVVVTVGFLLEDATYAAAVANPDISFVGVDQFYGDNDPIPNIVGLQFREDQGGFLVGAMAALMTQSGTVAGVYGIDIPPVVKFRNGFEQGVAYINAQDGTSVVALGVYVPDFLRPDLGQEAAAQFIGDGADVIFGAGGPTGSGGISYAAGEGVMVIGVDQDEYFTTFGGGEAPGAEFLITSAVKRVDNGVFQMIELLVNGGTFPENNTYVLEVANGGIGFAEAHDAEVPQEVTDRVAEIMAGLEDGSIETGVDPVTGALLNAPPVEEATEEATEAP